MSKSAFRRGAPDLVRQSESGFTLIELLIVLVILGIVLSIALPGFQNVFLSTRLANYANELVGSVYLARGEAIKRNANVRVCASADGINCASSGGWAQGWIVLDPNSNVLQEQTAFDGGFSIADSGGSHLITFSSAGAATPATNFKICRQTPTAGNQERQVAVSTVGRTNVTRTETGTCP